MLRRLLFRQTNRYLGVIPADGPLLVLGNHAASADPIALALGMSRPVHFMASEQLFRVPRLGRILRRLGAFPKAKYARDPESIEHMAALHADGRVVALFPEGNRTWDGRPGPVLPGLGWLIKKLGGPVVFVRNQTGWMSQPRWARYPRWVPMALEYSAPFVFPDDWSTTRIEEEVAARIRVDAAAVQLSGWSFGRRLAHGLPAYLWACPACFAIDALAVDPDNGDRVRCAGCGAAWRVDIRQGLTPVGADGKDVEGGQTLTVASATDAINAHFGELPTMDADRFVADGVALQDQDVAISRVAEGLVAGGLTQIARGQATLSADRLSVVGPEPWELPLEEIKAVSIEVGDALQLRTATELYQLDSASPIKWNHFLSRHVGRTKPTRRGRRR